MAKILIGFMGAGKSTVARLLDSDYIDMDEVIAQRIGMPIADFFAIQGENAFRQIESQVLEELLKSNHVVSTGGGVVTSKSNRRLLRNHSDTIYLRASFETVYNRIQSDESTVRPLFINNSMEDFKAIFDRRLCWYEEVASQVVDVDNKTPQAIVEVIK
ncbi:shikimate kinase [Streptococcus sciuri]|uniref:Shikimate kinase n=1 Tax=Streptococcus sciuri TaxID=2973939 RepID=A0ABT2F4V8_9STRE|nr:shikimate kinase [Streptococcus sciuri]MCS4487488.1 shikimate kinase [Streptococcus sciuri]